jgi:hypothetical protein
MRTCDAVKLGPWVICRAPFAIDSSGNIRQALQKVIEIERDGGRVVVMRVPNVVEIRPEQIKRLVRRLFGSVCDPLGLESLT